MLHIKLEGIPISSNHAYFTLRGGGRSLTKEGLKYKTETTSFIARNYPQALKYFVPDRPYTMVFQLTVTNETMFSKSYGKKGGAKNLFRKFDVSNRVKLLEDAITDATSIDDSCATTVLVRKVVGTKERTDVLVWRTDVAHDPFSAIIDSMVGT